MKYSYQVGNQVIYHCMPMEEDIILQNHDGQRGEIISIDNSTVSGYPFQVQFSDGYDDWLAEPEITPLMSPITLDSERRTALNALYGGLGNE